MPVLYLIESSFLGYAILLQVFFALITIFISYISYKLYRTFNQAQTKFMTMAFFFISASYGLQAFFNLLVLLGIQHDLYVMFGIHPLSVVNEQGLYVHALFLTIGLVFLMYNAFKTKNQSLLLYLVSSSFLVIFLSRNTLVGFLTLTALYLGFLSYSYYLNYLKNRKKCAFCIALAFLFLFLGHIILLLIKLSVVFYILAHIVNFIGYFLILMNYYIIKKNV